MKIKTLLEPGKLYLTLGTSQQVRFLFPDLPLEHLAQPTTQEITAAVESPERDQETLVIIRPYQHRIYPLKKTKSTADNDYLYGVPRKLGEPDPNAFYFICVDSLTHSEQKSFYKKLEGGYYVSVDLTGEAFDLVNDPRVQAAIETQKRRGTSIPSEYIEQICNERKLYPNAVIDAILSYPFISHVRESQYWTEKFIDTLIPIQQSQPPGQSRARSRQHRYQRLLNRTEVSGFCLDHMVYQIQTEFDTHYQRVSPLFRNLANPKLRERFVPYKTKAWGPGQALALYLQPFLELAATQYREAPEIPINAFVRWARTVTRHGTPYKKGISQTVYGSKGIKYTNVHLSKQAEDAWLDILNQLRRQVSLNFDLTNSPTNLHKL